MGKCRMSKTGTSFPPLAPARGLSPPLPRPPFGCFGTGSEPFVVTATEMVSGQWRDVPGQGPSSRLGSPCQPPPAYAHACGFSHSCRIRERREVGPSAQGCPMGWGAEKHQPKGLCWEPRGAGKHLLVPGTPGRPPSPLPRRPHTSTVPAAQCHRAPPRLRLGAPCGSIGHPDPSTHRCPRWSGRTRNFLLLLCPPWARFGRAPTQQPTSLRLGRGEDWRSPLPIPGRFMSILPSRHPSSLWTSFCMSRVGSRHCWWW